MLGLNIYLMRDGAVWKLAWLIPKRSYVQIILSAIFGLTKITYGDIGKGSLTHYRHRNMVNSSKTDIPKSQKDLFCTGNEVNPVRK